LFEKRKFPPVREYTRDGSFFLAGKMQGFTFRVFPGLVFFQFYLQFYLQFLIATMDELNLILFRFATEAQPIFYVFPTPECDDIHFSLFRSPCV